MPTTPAELIQTVTQILNQTFLRVDQSAS